MKKAGHILTYPDVCRNCRGECYLAEIHPNTLKPVICDVCKGSGMVTVKKEISITITPKAPMNEVRRN
ncbi:hypothetical protein [Carboxylicivirga linearis]|uniref:Molecular chaperone DnaJ n=1 Tax=Carboxylicivirga linearis TaxID=1628157 RepID=A0ABS5K149_9BACT|nr:hypothetical protein [Carboxylicivirga linearis]MBS2100419.1 hypothetical protein [Carboxylicivirga linearis]